MIATLFGLDTKGNVKQWSIDVVGFEIHVWHGRVGGKLQHKITFCEGKNIGKANETTPEGQARLEAQSKIQKQLDKNYRYSVEELQVTTVKLPMLAHDYLKQGHRVQFPCYVSPKLDGVRCMAFVEGSNVHLMSRSGKEYDCPKRIREALVTLCALTGERVFDGELYIHEMPLQDIVSCVKKHNENTEHLMYHIFDLPDSTDRWEDRVKQLEKIAKNTFPTEPIVVVPNWLVHDEDEARQYLTDFIEWGFEGLMFRNLDGVYNYGHRSADLQKWKLMSDLEARVIAVRRDKNDEAVYECQYTDITFECKIKGSHELRSFKTGLTHIGDWMTVKYQTLTKDGVPQFPVGLYFRDCDKDGIPLV